MLGELHARLGETRRALESYAAGLAAVGWGESELVSGLARVQERAGRPDLSRETLQRGRKHAPDDRGLLRALAGLSERQSAFTEALTLWRKLCDLPAAEATDRETARAHARALELMLGPGERLRAPFRCRRSSPVERALAGCDAPAPGARRTKPKTGVRSLW